MATLDSRARHALAQPFSALTPTQQQLHQHALAEHMDQCLCVLNVAERLPVFSQDILEAARKREPHQRLLRRLQGLHAQLVELADVAFRAKYAPIDAVSRRLPNPESHASGAG